MVKICLVVLVGLPGAGKTSFCKKYQQHVDKMNIIHICYDEIIKFNAEQKQGFYKDSRKGILEKIRMLIRNLKTDNLYFLTDSTESNQINFLKFNKNYKEYIILMDDNNYYLGMRYEFYKICREFEISFAQLFFQIQLVTAIERNLSRTINRIPEYIIQRMNERFQVPNHKWEENTLYLHEYESIDFTNVDLFLAKSLNYPLKLPIKAQNFQVEQSKVHKIDLVLRKKIKNILEARKSEGSLNILASNLNNLRKSILNDIRNGFLEIDVNQCEKLTQLLSF